MTKLIGKGQAMRQLSPDEYNSEFERNYEYYRQRMERRLVKQVYDRERFDDICQDAFVRALTYFARQNAKLPQTDYHLGNLLCDIAVQAAIDDYRKNKKSKDYLLLSEIEDKQLLELMVEGDENWICDRDRLQEVLAQMPLRHQQIVRLIEQGLNQKEIAAELGKSAATVSGIMRDVRTQLQKRNYYPVPIDLRRAEILKKIQRNLRNTYRDAIAIFDRDLLAMQYTGHRHYTEKQLRVADELQLSHIVFERHKDLFNARMLAGEYIHGSGKIKLVVPRRTIEAYNRDSLT